MSTKSYQVSPSLSTISHVHSHPIIHVHNYRGSNTRRGVCAFDLVSKFPPSPLKKNDYHSASGGSAGVLVRYITITLVGRAAG